MFVSLELLIHLVFQYRTSHKVLKSKCLPRRPQFCFFFWRNDHVNFVSPTNLIDQNVKKRFKKQNQEPMLAKRMLPRANKVDEEISLSQRSKVIINLEKN